MESVIWEPMFKLDGETFNQMFGDKNKIVGLEDLYREMVGKNLHKFVKRQSDKERKSGTWCEKTIATKSKCRGEDEFASIRMSPDILGLYFRHKHTMHQLIPNFGERKVAR
jgi:hypothetical protein